MSIFNLYRDLPYTHYSTYSQRYIYNERNDPSGWEAIRDHLLQTGRGRGLMVVSSILLQAVATAGTLSQQFSPLSWVPIGLTALFTAVWFWLWYRTGAVYSELRGNFINSARDEESSHAVSSPPFWVDQGRIGLAFILYAQVVVILALLAGRSPNISTDLREVGSATVSLLAILGPVITWPVALLISVASLGGLFKSQVAGSKIKRTKKRRIEQAQDKIMALEVKADNAKLPEPTKQASEGEAEQVSPDVYRLLMSTNPSVAILLAWRDIELQLFRIAELRGIAGLQRIGPFELVKQVTAALPVPPEVAGLLEELRVIRNRAVHRSKGESFSQAAAEEYVRLSRRVIAWLEQMPGLDERPHAGQPA